MVKKKIIGLSFGRKNGNSEVMFLDFSERAENLQPFIQLFRKYRFDFGNFLWSYKV